MNRLADETSPYLLQHAHNPVDWYPWGPEAFERAKREERPVLLSIGYAACHWCHVMERESFEDEAIAGAMNESFVCVKVDREERPDVDGVYMDALQAMTQHGGWPMTMFLTPDGVPFFGGTYYPPEDRHGMPAFAKILDAVATAWRDKRRDVVRQGQEVVARITRITPPPSNEPLVVSILSGAARQLASAADAVNGGFGSAPKFPQAPLLELALRLERRWPNSMKGSLALTLHRMALGGIYDQVGGGFHRYSVDETWLVPHFEKMLYDNAQLARVYLHAWQATHEPLYRRVCEETLDYLLRDMRDPRGGFHSSEDADSDGEEGRFYVWSLDELNADEAAWFGATAEGNFEGSNILTAQAEGTPSRDRLLELRSHRVRPGKDDKVLASWNGLAIAALAQAGAAFERDDLLDAARAAADFVLREMRNVEGRLLHAWRDGRASVLGFLEDYAYVADGLFDLWRATFESRWLESCRELVGDALRLFGDSRSGAFYVTGSDHEELIVRQKDLVESATPSAGATLSLVVQSLGALLEDSELARPGVDALRVAHVYMTRAPQAVPTWLSALDRYLAPPREVALIGDMRSADGRRLLAVVSGRYAPNLVVAGGDTEAVPLLAGRPTVGGRPTAYVCERGACKLPTADPDELARQLDA